MTKSFYAFLFFVFISIFSLNAQVFVTRGPYLQKATSNSIVIKWRTNTATSSRVIYGTDPLAQTNTVSLNNNTTDHEVELTGLLPDTKYYYSIGNASNLIATGTDQFFYTHTPIGVEREYNFWVLGDCGTATNDQRNVRDAFLQYNNGKRIDGILLLGDNAYDFGTDGQYQDAIFNNMYEDIIINTVMWPTPGNHDYYSGADAATQSGPYYDIFTLPKNGELGGFPSGTEAYYSFNIGNIHFISLDSYDSPRDSSGAMVNWLRQDLQQNQQEWTIVFFHHAPYTKGSHNSDNPFPYIDFELPEVREQILPILERGGVDLILCGHSHSYERSYLLNGHYGKSNTLQPSHKLDAGSGDFITDCPYHKNTLNGKANKGTVYTVCGVSGKKSGTSSGWPHPAMYTSSVDHFGSMILTIKNNRLDAKFLTSNQTIFDQFTIIKNAGGKTTVPFCQGQPLTLTGSFPHASYTWQPGNITGNQLTITPYFNSVYYGADPMGCIRDTFQLVAIQPGSPQDTCGNGMTALTDFDLSKEVDIYPNPVVAGSVLQIQLPSALEFPLSVQLLNASGIVVGEVQIPSEKFTLHVPQGLSAGAYLLRFYQTSFAFTKHLLIIQP